jgi:hypothetical protein
VPDQPSPDVSKLIQGILRHDRKLNTYKLALIRALNDTALNFAALQGQGRGVAVPLRVIAEAWIGYYWPFMDEERPVFQGPRVFRDRVLRQDVAFRPLLTELKRLWRASPFGSDRPADGMVLVSEMHGGLRGTTYGPDLITRYAHTLRAVARCVQQPITYAGSSGEQYQVFSKQRRLSDLPAGVMPLPGSRTDELCVVVLDAMWEGFKHASVYIDALCIHEWSLFAEHVRQTVPDMTRGHVYQALTDRPDRRRPLTWERNQLDLLLLEGHEMHCLWTGRPLFLGGYDVDHLIPVATTPINEQWNLVPSDPGFNQHVKRAQMPGDEWRSDLPRRLEATYRLYGTSAELESVLRQGSYLRFAADQVATLPRLSEAVTLMVYAVAEARNTPRFGRSV